MEFLHLGIASGSIFKFNKNKNSELGITYQPSLSPKDSHFPAWWEEHKFFWEAMEKRIGQEPADD